MSKPKIELSYLDGDDMQRYAIQLSDEEYKILNRQMLLHHGKADTVTLALKDLTRDENCSKHHKAKINEIVSKTLAVNFKLISC